ncbi:MAG: cation:proton antiporter [Candidatus Woesearchaeota archaeon]|nr:MAG: cation:proton antiporter [Candidatus Woesearchaeota archaeon]
MVVEGIFLELSIVLLITAIFGFIMRWLKQPIILAYLLTGILISPSVLNIVSSGDALGALSSFGVALLLFMVGLNLNPKVVRESGIPSVLLASLQIVLTVAVSFFASFVLGYSLLASFYIAIALSFSSTIIILKLLADRGELQTLSGRIATGVLIVQDIVAVFLLIFLSGYSAQTNVLSFIATLLLRGFFLIAILFLIAHYFLPRVIRHVAKNQEFLLLFSLMWCFVVSSLFAMFELSIEIGALIAGVTLSVSHFRYEISSKMKPLRDFFLILFFVWLGLQVRVGMFISEWVSIVVFSFIAIFGHFIIIFLLMNVQSYTKRNSFLTALSLSQISEFSLIVAAIGVKNGHLTQDLLALLTIVALISFGVSSYFISHAGKLYHFFMPLLARFERRGKKVDDHHYAKGEEYDIILFGYNRIGFDLLESFHRIKKKFLIIDYNPDTIIKLSREGYDCKYGDASDLELLKDIDYTKVKMVISTIPELEVNLLIHQVVKEVNKDIITIAVSHQIDEATQLYAEGISYVIMPHFLGGHHAATMIEQYGFDVSKFLQEKISHLEHLQSRKQVGHTHPENHRNTHH